MFLKLLELKKGGRLYKCTRYIRHTQNGNVFFKEQKFGVNYKVNSWYEVEKRLAVNGNASA